MAEVVRYVDPDATGSGTGVDWTNAYTSLSAWEAAEQTDLVSDGDWHHVYCRSSSATNDTTATTIDGWTTDATHYVQIEDYDDTYNLYVSNDSALTIKDNHIRLVGMNIESHSLTTNYKFGVTILLQSAGSEIRILGCTITADVSGSYICCPLNINDSDVTVIAVNNLLKNNTTSSSALSSGAWVNDCSSTYFYNNTFSGGSYGVHVVSGTVTAINNILYNGSVGSTSGTFTGSDYNSTDAGSIGTGGSNDRISQTFSFVDTDDYRLASDDTGAIDYGTDLSSDSIYPFDDDIDGDTRSAPWDIGADEYQASGGYTLTADAGTFSITGQPVLLTKTNVLSAESGSLNISGKNVTLTYSGAVSAYYEIVSINGALTTKTTLDASLISIKSINGQAISIEDIEGELI